MPPFSKTHQPKHRSKRVDQTRHEEVEQPAEDRVGQMADRLRFSTDTGPQLPYPKPAEMSVEDAESALFQTNEAVAEQRAAITAELARMDAAVLLARRDLDAAKQREYEAEQKRRALAGPRLLAESRRTAALEAEAERKRKASEPRPWHDKVVAALEPVKKELVGIRALCAEWIEPLKKLDDTAYRELPASWSFKARDVVARQRTTALKLHQELVHARDAMLATIRSAEDLLLLEDEPRTADQRTAFNEVLSRCRSASSGHTAYLTTQIVKMFNLVNDTIASEGGLVEDDITVASEDRVGKNTSRARVESIKKAIKPFTTNEPEQVFAEGGDMGAAK